MNETQKLRTKALLDEIVAFLNEDTGESGHLWSILTALRGPDDGDWELKQTTTARLRGAIGLTINGGIDISLEPPERFQGGLTHFHAHYNHAFDILKEMGIISLREDTTT
jgi:hypothetical protein